MRRMVGRTAPINAVTSTEPAGTDHADKIKDQESTGTQPLDRQTGTCTGQTL